MIQYEEEERRRTCKLCHRYIIGLSNHEGAGGFLKRERERVMMENKRGVEPYA